MSGINARPTRLDMIKRIYFRPEYTPSMVAELESPYSRDVFWQSKKLSLDPLNFSCKCTAQKIYQQDIINSTAGSFLVSERTRAIVDAFVPSNTLQFLPAILKCHDNKLIYLYLVNTLHQEKIVDIEASEKLKVGPSDDDFILLDRGLIFVPGALKEKKIGRNLPNPHNTEIFLHDDLVQLLIENKIDKNIIFD